MRLRILALAAVTLAAGCGGDSATLNPQIVCSTTSYRLCLEQFEFMGGFQGQMVAVCEYKKGRGAIVLLYDQPSRAEGACSADGLTKPSRVVAVGLLP